MNATNTVFTLALLAFGVLLGAVGIFLSVGPADFRAARLVVMLAVVPMILGDAVWAVATPVQMIGRILISGTVGAVVAFGCVELLLWIDRRDTLTDPPKEADPGEQAS